jgi:hypothetical protein
VKLRLAPRNGILRTDDSRVYSRERFARFDRLSDEEQARWSARAEANRDKTLNLLFAYMDREVAANEYR